ncbi:prefoldin subunit 1 [Kwoniella mangroviensis CBS 10435]|uniref:Prefoldin subunit 1 n=1 Tax=Kwoniella mangroviensis CBS 10435 TaxID=1331196 RepID=A0A1B9J2R8_9TREE|nr:prefoldin subunit 1 [Kwoniella mangroviensis CBS 8507]OCF62055.1 prefoldin subunit 1 [Kwoniella mangroviensis CBS 10435]OCF66929.1 prefoldin subunit 1 [Kwoniella mangroviensis CBS 8507]OCF73371.1 prefoldin subunit 1 [Kwoniella mangroviensis CBS 8886]
MSGLSDDTLRKILTQIQQQAIQSQKQLSIVRAQIQSKEKEKKILSLTVRELDTVPRNGVMYKGVGKMFIQQDRKEVDSEHSTQEKQLNDELNNLTKKSKYLEKQFEEANSQLKDIFHSQQRQAA